MNDLPTIAANLRTQDNRMTSRPIFLVQQKQRIHGLEESDQYLWIDECGEEVDDQMAIALDCADQDNQDTVLDPDNPDRQLDMADYRKSYYRDEYQFVQPFFTEHGAQEYLKINSHNLREPRIYVECGYRNEEWEMVRQHLMGAPGGWKS